MILGMRTAALLLVLAAAGLAQDDAGKLREQAVALAAQGKYADAEPLLKKAIEARENETRDGDPRLSDLIEELASVSRAQARNEDAEKLYLRSLALKQVALGAESAEIIPDVRRLAGLYVSSSASPRPSSSTFAPSPWA